MTALLSRVGAEPKPTPERFTHSIYPLRPQPLYWLATMGAVAPREQAR